MESEVTVQGSRDLRQWGVGQKPAWEELSALETPLLEEQKCNK